MNATVFKMNCLYDGHALANAAFQEQWINVMKEFGCKVDSGSDTVASKGMVFCYQQGNSHLLSATVEDDYVVMYNNDGVFKWFCDFLEERGCIYYYNTSGVSTGAHMLIAPSNEYR